MNVAPFPGRAKLVAVIIRKGQRVLTERVSAHMIDMSGPDGPVREGNPWRIDSQSAEEHEADAVAALRTVRGDTTAALLVRHIDRLTEERDDAREELAALRASIVADARPVPAVPLRGAL